MELTYFVDVILPLSAPNTYTYRVPRDMVNSLVRGARVLVSFGSTKIYSAVIAKIHHKAPEHYTAKYLDAIIDSEPVITDLQMDFIFWISDYYQCYPGEVLLASLPASMRLASETIILPVFDNPDLESRLDDTEFKIYDALLQAKRMNLSEVGALLGKKQVYPHIRAMLEKGAIEIEEEVKDKYKPLIKKFLSLPVPYQSEEGINALFEQVQRAPKQADALLAFSAAMGNDFSKRIERSVLTKKYNLNAAAIKGLVDKGLLKQKEIAVDRILPNHQALDAEINLSSEQQRAFNEIKDGFAADKPTLLHGVTGSGKTEIYIKLIEECLASGQQALYLVPEIALTSQLTLRLEKYFGSKLRVYHSRFSQHERTEIWYKLIHDKDVQLIVGARSCMLMPFENLGLIIVDEEHDSSYKQQHPAPRYLARDAANYLAHLHKAKVLFGSATPSLESFRNAKQGKFAYVSLLQRFGQASLPVIEIIDLKIAQKKGQMHGDFSKALVDKIAQVLENKEQVILFQNRRGYSPRWICTTCSWIAECKNCDISLTFHKGQNAMRCHYCGYSLPAPRKCLACGSDHLKMMGFGTEKIEEDLSELFPDARIARMDHDTTRGKHAYQQLIHDFQEGNIDVLVGTQMVTKGLDFDRVALVGVLSADQMLSFPDFRAQERAFQLMTQVAGRAGRREKQGRVYIQSYQSEHWLLEAVRTGDWKKMYQMELADRQTFSYPPYCRMIKLSLKHKDQSKLEHAARYLATGLQQGFKEYVLGPEYPGVPRVKNQYIMEFIIKLQPKTNLAKAKAFIKQCSDLMLQEKEYRSVRVIVDVDPY